MIMSANGPSDFKFSSGDEQQDAILQRKRKNRRVAKSGARLTVFFIFLLLVLGALFAFAYMDIKKRVALLEEAGERNVQEMVAEMESQVARVTERYDELQKSLTKKVFPMDEIFLALESSTSALEKELKTLETRVTAIQKTQSDKADSAALDKAVAQMTESLPPVQEKIETLTARLKAVETAGAERQAALDARMASHEEKLATLTAAVQEYADAAAKAGGIVDENLSTLNGEIASVKTAVSALTSVAIDQKTLDEALESQSAALRKRIERLSTAMNQNETAIGRLRSRVDRVAAMAESSAKALKERPAKTVQVPPQPGTFLEQDIE